MQNYLSNMQFYELSDRASVVPISSCLTWSAYIKSSALNLAETGTCQFIGKHKVTVIIFFHLLCMHINCEGCNESQPEVKGS